MIVTERLTKRYGSTVALDSVDLKIEAGEVFGFLGPNGAGKTTAIRILTTLTRPDSGRAWVDGTDVVNAAARVKSAIGVVQQHLSLDRELTVAENLEIHARLHHLSPHERRQRMAESMAFAGLTEQAGRLVNDLSGGMKRRVMIARALLHHPKVLFLDEPTVGLDAHSRRRLWDLIRRLNSDGSTVFLTTHYIEEAESLCHRVGILHEGRLIAQGSPRELRQKLGLTAIEVSVDGTTQYHFFPDHATARDYAQMLPFNARSLAIRDTNLEDVFVELTGSKVIPNG